MEALTVTLPAMFVRKPVEMQDMPPPGLGTGVEWTR